MPKSKRKNRKAIQRQRRRRRTGDSLVVGPDHLFYPLHTGWSDLYTPLFKLPSEACCFQLSRYHRDGLSHCGIEDTWLSRVGVFKSSNTLDIRLSKIPSSKPSALEKLYFQGVKFYKLEGNCREQSSIVEVPHDTFETCKSTLTDIPDYMASSGSIFKGKCVRTETSNPMKLPFIQGSRCTKNEANGLFAFAHALKNKIRNNFSNGM